MLGCRKAYMAAHSEKKSLTAFSDSILNIFIATVVYRHNPLYMIPYPPSEIWLSKTNYSKSISMLQLNIRGCMPNSLSICFSSTPKFDGVYFCVEFLVFCLSAGVLSSYCSTKVLPSF